MQRQKLLASTPASLLPRRDSLGTSRRDTAAVPVKSGAPRRRPAGAAPLQEEEEKNEEEEDDEEEDAGEEEKEEAWLLERFYGDR